MPRRPFVKLLSIFFISLLILINSCKKGTEIKAISTYKVIKKNFNETINDTGEIGSENESRIVAPFSSKIDNLIDEGLIVKKDTLVGRLATVNEEKEKDKQFLSNEEAVYDFKIATLAKKKDTYRLNKETENARLDIKIAELKLKSLVEGRDGLGIVKAREELNTIEKEMKIYQLEIPEQEKLYKTGYLSFDELVQAKNKLAELTRQKQYQLANDKVLEKGPLKEEIEKERVNLETAKQNFAKKQQEFATLIKTSDIAIEDSQVRIKTSKEKLNYYSELVKLGDLRATDNGMVIYGKMPVGEEEVKVKAGDSVREGVNLIKIFDLKKPVLRMYINEVDISKVHIGQQILFNLDAYPEKSYKGKISNIAPIANKKFEGDKNNVEVFEVTIKILDISPILKPGMTANIEIMVNNLNNVFTVPSQAIFQENEKNYCYLKTKDKIVKQPVSAGISNDLETVVSNGLKEGDEVVMDYQEVNS